MSVLAVGTARRSSVVGAPVEAKVAVEVPDEVRRRWSEPPVFVSVYVCRSVEPPSVTGSSSWRTSSWSEPS